MKELYDDNSDISLQEKVKKLYWVVFIEHISSLDKKKAAERRDLCMWNDKTQFCRLNDIIRFLAPDICRKNDIIWLLAAARKTT